MNAINDWQERRKQILVNMQMVMGPLPAADKKVPWDIQVSAVENLPRCVRQKISYASEKDHRVPAYLLIPNDLKDKTPAVLCLHGTGGGRGRIAGLGPDYPRYALELAERGYITIAPDYPLLGDNNADLEKLGYVSGSMKGIWDNMRAIDILQSLPEVDGERIGVIGLSLGGHNSLFTAAFDQRIKVIVSSCGFDSFLDYQGGNLNGWCGPRYMPRIATVYGKDPDKVPFDFPEVLAALAPRPLFVHTPLKDENFKVASVQRCLDAAKAVYRLYEAEDRIAAIYPDGGHDFPAEAREEAYRFIDKALAVGALSASGGLAR